MTLGIVKRVFNVVGHCIGVQYHKVYNSLLLIGC